MDVTEGKSGTLIDLLSHTPGTPRQERPTRRASATLRCHVAWISIGPRAACYSSHVLASRLKPDKFALLLATTILIAALGSVAFHPQAIAQTAKEGGRTAEIAASIAAARWAEADALLRSELLSGPETAPALYNLGLVLFHEDHPRESLLTYTHAAKQAPPSAQSLRIVALDYVLLQDFVDADRWITVAAQKDPSDGEIWYSMGRIKYTENRFAESVESFKKALALMPKSVKVENNLGLAYEGLNEPDEAITAYRQAISWQQGVPQPSEQPLLNLGSLLTDRNALDEALPLLLEAESIAPKDGKIHGALGKLYMRLHELPQAQIELEQATASSPNNAGLHFQLGQVYRKEGFAERSKQELKRAAELTGTHSSEPDKTE